MYLVPAQQLALSLSLSVCRVIKASDHSFGEMCTPLFPLGHPQISTAIPSLSLSSSSPLCILCCDPFFMQEDLKADRDSPSMVPRNPCGEANTGGQTQRGNWVQILRQAESLGDSVAERSRHTCVLWGSQEGGLGHGSLYTTKSLARARWAPGWTFWGGTLKVSLTSSPAWRQVPPPPTKVFNSCQGEFRF